MSGGRRLPVFLSVVNPPSKFDHTIGTSPFAAFRFAPLGGQPSEQVRSHRHVFLVLGKCEVSAVNQSSKSDHIAMSFWSSGSARSRLSTNRASPITPVARCRRCRFSILDSRAGRATCLGCQPTEQVRSRLLALHAARSSKLSSVSAVNQPSKSDHRRRAVGDEGARAVSALGCQPTEQVRSLDSTFVPPTGHGSERVSAVNQPSKSDHNQSIDRASAPALSPVSAVNQPSKSDHPMLLAIVASLAQVSAINQPSKSDHAARRASSSRSCPRSRSRLSTNRASPITRAPLRLGSGVPGLGCQPTEQVRSQLVARRRRSQQGVSAVNQPSKCVRQLVSAVNQPSKSDHPCGQPSEQVRSYVSACLSVVNPPSKSKSDHLSSASHRERAE